MAATTIHQLDKSGQCEREYSCYNRPAGELEALHERIKGAFNMQGTMVTVDGDYAFGALGTHAKELA